MGKLTVMGKAEKSYTCDMMIITLSFQAYEKNTSSAVEIVMSQCERFLEILEEQGFDISNIHIGDNGVQCRKDDDNGELVIEAEREIKLRLAFDMKVLNEITEIIAKNSNYVDMDVSFTLSTMAESHNQLIKEAVIDSQKKAEMIAETTGQKVIGIDTMKIGDKYGRIQMNDEEIHYMKSSEPLSRADMLKAPMYYDTNEVEVTWIIE